MRPKRLVIEGLRSYRAKTTIDFTDASLFAIVGDTGSGKSSILEAIVYALYASTTWGRQGGDLISDGMRSMTVELAFEVDGRDWLVRRSMSREGYPAPVHLLEAVDDHTLRFDQAANVNAEIERLLGLNYEAFCSAVVLPQGQFQRLLTSTPAERTKTLKGIFRLERLEEVRLAAKAIFDKGEPRWRDLREQRAKLADDPRGAAALAAGLVTEADQELALLASLSAKLADLARTAEAAGRRGEAVGREAETLAIMRGSLDGDEGSRLLALEVELEGEFAPRRAALSLAAEAETVALQALEAAKLAGEDDASLARYRDALSFAQNADIRQRLRDREKDVAAAADAERTWAAAQEALTDLAAATKTAVADAAATHAEADRVRQIHDQVAGRLTHARTLARLAMAARIAAVAAAEEAGLKTASTQTATLAQSAAEAALTESETALAAARAHDAAATAAHGLHPGDACPVCARRLPPSWRPPNVGDLEAAVQARNRDDERLRAARQVAVAAERDAATATEQARGMAETADRAEGDLATEVAAVRAHLPDWSTAADNPSAIAPLAERLAAALTAAGIADEAAAAAHGAEIAEEARVTERRSSLDDRARLAAQTNERLEGDISGLRDRLGLLPASLAVEVDAPMEAFEASFGRLELLEADAAARAAAMVSARNDRVRLGGEIEEFERRFATEVSQPLAARRETITRLGAALERAEDILALERSEPSDEAGTVARADQLNALLTNEARRCATTASEASDAGTALMHEHGLADDAALTDRVRTVTGARAVAEAEQLKADGQVAPAAALDKRIQEGGALLMTLRELVRLLGDGGFVGYVVAERQQALLGVASAIFADMSGGRYGFAEDFEIVDRTSGQPRSPKTLSGGESFQASLALALGLVELAGRSGGRLSSLFLDEGFGTLDANALDEALEELERRAASGRVIGVISHLRAVADRIEHVLRVDKEFGRTHVEWLGSSERDHMNAEDLSHAGLTG